LIVVLGSGVLFLRNLEHAPYRPPHDMSTLLGAREQAAVRTIWISCSVVLGGAVVALVATYLPRSSR